MVYSHVWSYRLVMSVLYAGGYRARFAQAAALLRPTDGRVLELCFGDVVLAGYCRRCGKRWTGLDINPRFVAYAVRKGFDARQADLSRSSDLPACDVCVMMGSLYHFRAALPELLYRIRAASGRLILSEPVRNWTNGNGLCRFLAQKGTRIGAEEETFRFDEASLRATLDELKTRVGFTYRVVHVARDMVVEVVWSN